MVFAPPKSFPINFVNLGYLRNLSYLLQYELYSTIAVELHYFEYYLESLFKELIRFYGL